NFDGVIIEPTKSAQLNPNLHYYIELERKNIPYVMLNAYYEVLDCPYVILNDVKGGYLQTKHLIENGHRNLLGFFKKDDQQGMNRMKGYLKAHRNNNLKVNEKNIVLYLTEDKDTKPKKMLNHILDND